ncbi:hypothetical protein [Bradyrhizobium sp. BR 10289]|nr:hypothetical protein [Bradyrhizobium sp. BR 10289]MBW7974101.1 hypothetical protein [Bradyrhizobium sp. BR 10289]
MANNSYRFPENFKNVIGKVVSIRDQRDPVADFATANGRRQSSTRKTTA